MLKKNLTMKAGGTVVGVTFPAPPSSSSLLPFVCRIPQLLPVLRLWLEPAADDRAFLPPTQRASLLKVLMALPVQKSHLKESGLGKLAVAMAADPEETRDNRELIKQVREKACMQAPSFTDGPGPASEFLFFYARSKPARLVRRVSWGRCRDDMSPFCRVQRQVF